MTAPPSPSPALSTGGPGGPLVNYLRDPTGTLHQLETDLRQYAIAAGPVTLIAIAILAVITVLGHRWLQQRRQQALTRDARLITVLAPPQVDPAGAEALWANLTGLLRPAWRRRLSGQPHVTFEYAFSHDGLTLRFWVPGLIPPGMVEHAIEAAWPGTRTTTHPASDAIRTRAGSSVIVGGGELRLARPETLPIRTAFTADPIRALLGAPAGIDDSEQAIVQVLARPVVGRRVNRAGRAATRLHAGGSPRLIGRVLDLVTPGPTRRPLASTSARATQTADRVTMLDYAAQDRAAAVKQRGPLFETRIRYALTIDLPTDATKEQQVAARDRIRGRSHAIASAFAAFGEHNHYRRHRPWHPDQLLQSRRLGRGDLLSIPELAAIAHIPTDPAAPGLQHAGARAVAPPPGIPATGADVKPLGVADPGRTRLVGLAVADARQHLHVLGATGSGKSTLMAQLILADVHANRGVVVIDPKGDLITDVLDRLPAQAINRVVLFDADSRHRPPCLNPLDPGPSAHERTAPASGAEVVVDNLTSIFARVYAAFWGPRTDDILRAACLTLRAQPDTASLADLPRLLADEPYRTAAVRHVTDPVLTGFWDWYGHLSDAARAQAIAPLMNKLRAFLLRPFVRDALAGGPTTLNMPAILDNGGVCLVRIPKGSLGEETTKLVGSLVVASVWQSATARAATPEARRPDCGLYVDECQNFLNLPYPLEDMLAEARGFHLSMTLAHQHLGQLSHDLKDGISANARSKIFFSASPEDAHDLARHTAPRITEHDLAHLGAFHAAARLVVRGETAAPFTFTTRPLPHPIPGRAATARRAAARAANRPTAAPRSPTSAHQRDPRLTA